MAAKDGLRTYGELHTELEHLNFKIGGMNINYLLEQAIVRNFRRENVVMIQKDKLYRRAIYKSSGATFQKLVIGALKDDMTRYFPVENVNDLSKELSSKVSHQLNFLLPVFSLIRSIEFAASHFEILDLIFEKRSKYIRDILPVTLVTE